jgi:PKD repeat protein
MAAFAAERASDGALTVMVVSKALAGTTATTLDLASFGPGSVAQVWQLKAGTRITRLADVAVSQKRVTATLPPQSVTLFVVAKGATLPNQPPVSYPMANPGAGPAPLPVTFIGAMSYDNDGTIVSYLWNFGDGATATTSGATHTYTAPGTYQATLTVTDDRGASSSDFVTVVVTAPPATVAAPSGLTGSASGKTVTLRWTDNSTNEDGFHVERGVAGKGKGATTTWTRIATVGANVKTFAHTTTSGTVLYRVQAFRGSVVSAYSNQVSVRVR